MFKLTRYTENLDSSGDFLTLEDANAIIDAIVKTLSIQKGTYIADPEVGSDLYKYLYEPLDEDTISDVESEVLYSLDQVDKLTVKKVNAIPTKDRKSIIINIDAIIDGRFSKKISIVATDQYISLLEVD